MPPRTRTTDRSITMCRPCRRRKIRCGRERPSCKRCSETGALCVYEDQARRRVREYQFVEETPGPVLAGEEASTSSTSGDRLRNIEALVERLHRVTQSLRTQTTASSRNASGPSIRDANPTETIRTALEENDDSRSIEAALWTSLREDAAQLHELLSQPTNESTPGQDEPSEQLNREFSMSNPEAAFAFNPDPAIDAVPDIDWAYIDEVISGLHNPETFQPGVGQHDGGGQGGGDR